jgi:hypothetical protein
MGFCVHDGCHLSKWCIFTNRIQGNYEIWYTQDMIVLDADGSVLLNKEGALNFRHSGRAGFGSVCDRYSQR